MKSSIGIALLSLLSAPAQALINADFEAETGAWGDREGPPGWELRLDRGDQLGIVEDIDFATSGQRAFYFSAHGRGFGDARMDQCIELDDTPALMLSTDVLTDEPHPELAVRLRVDFYADSDCDEDSVNADAEQIETNISLDPDRAPAGQWVRLESETRWRGALGADVASARVSLRVRDRSNDGQPREPARIVWLDSVSLEPDITLLPSAQREALREIHAATGGDDWHRSLNWMGAAGTECRWHGVRCSDDGSTITGLDLAALGLSGEIPAAITALADLATGEGLDLCWNDITVAEAARDFVGERHFGGGPENCLSRSLVPTSPLSSGMLYDPAQRDGDGLIVNMVSAGAAIVFWSTYDDRGEPLWLVGSGRATRRVIDIDDLYVSRLENGEVALSRAGRARLALTGCDNAQWRFQATGQEFGASDNRELVWLDARESCSDEAPDTADGLVHELAGKWYDPAHDGEGLGLVAIDSDTMVLNYFAYGDSGQPVWYLGVGEARDGQLEFDEMITAAGGSFNQPIQPGDLEIIAAGSALIEPTSAGWQFRHHPSDGPVRELDIQRLHATPQLQASAEDRLFLSMARDDLDELYTRSIWSNDRLPGQIRFNDRAEAEDLVGLRFRGNTSRAHPKKSFNIRFERAQDLLFGSDRMNLNAMYTDPAMMREAISFEMFRALGQPASLTRYFDFWLNGRYEGLHIHIQRVDEWLLSLNDLNPDGTLVRDEFRDNPDLPVNSSFAHDFSDLEPDERTELLAGNFNYRGDPEWERVMALIEWVQETPAGSEFASGFEERINRENFIDWLVLHWLIGDIDSFGDDYWLYLDHDDPEARWQVIPWDKDQTFGSHFRPGFFTTNDFFAYEYELTASGWGNRLVEKFLATDSLRTQAEQRLIELIDEVFTEDWVHARIDELAERLEDSINIGPGELAFDRHASNHHGEPGRLADHVESVRDFVSLRYRFIRARLEGGAGDIDQASAELPAAAAETSYLTDASGFTLASVTPQQATPEPTNLALLVSPDTNVRGIDRVWDLDVDGPTGDFDLALYYRNEVSQSWGRGNWWTEGDEPIGEQDRLVIEMERVDGSFELLDTRVNPHANKAVTRLELGPGNHRFRLVLPDPDS